MAFLSAIGLSLCLYATRLVESFVTSVDWGDDCYADSCTINWTSDYTTNHLVSSVAHVDAISKVSEFDTCADWF